MSEEKGPSKRRRKAKSKSRKPVRGFESPPPPRSVPRGKPDLRQQAERPEPEQQEGDD